MRILSTVLTVRGKSERRSRTSGHIVENRRSPLFTLHGEELYIPSRKFVRIASAPSKLSICTRLDITCWLKLSSYKLLLCYYFSAAMIIAL